MGLPITMSLPICESSMHNIVGLPQVWHILMKHGGLCDGKWVIVKNAVEA